jgi:energy-coupling factor transporter ATP-binding protein EcfA2
MSPQSVWENANCEYGEEGEGGGEEEHRTNLSWCSICGCWFCESCWDKERAHWPRKNPTVAAIHQKTNVRIAKLVDSILHPRADIENSKKRHRENRATKWIGVSTDEHGTPTMKDFRRFEDLAFDQENPSEEQFPSLVTFVGSTGAGKSTLINALIKARHIVMGHVQLRSSLTLEQMKKSSVITPAIGNDVGLPTSGDVHLFPDPETYGCTRPIYYADCEGLHGGDGKPKANVVEEEQVGETASARQSHLDKLHIGTTAVGLLNYLATRSYSRDGSRNDHGTSSALRTVSLGPPEGPDSRKDHRTLSNQRTVLARTKQVLPVAQAEQHAQDAAYEARAQHAEKFEISWADKTSREKLVSTLYPRSLFTFSDVVVFVSKEHRYRVIHCRH